MSRAFYPQLEGIRGVAVLLVLFSHFVIISYFPNLRFLNLGFLGVNIFFVLSGFLITEILIKDIERKRSGTAVLKNFYVKRVLRIFPIYYLTLFILFVLNISESREIILWTSTYILNVGQNWFGVSDPYFMHIWSLCVEEQFYIFWPLLLLSVPPNKRVAVLVVLISISVLFKLSIAFFGFSNAIGLNHSSTIASVDALGLGGLLAVIKEQNRDFFVKLVKLPDRILPLLLVAFFLLSYFNPEHSIFNEVFFRLMTAAMGGLLVAKSVNVDDTLQAKILNWGIIRYIGKISYGIYLFHWFVYSSLKEGFIKIWSSIDFGGFQLLKYQQYLGAFVFFTGITLALATISYYVVERPFLKLKKRYSS